MYHHIEHYTTPYKQLQHALNEKYHVYLSDDTVFQIDLQKAWRDIISQLNNGILIAKSSFTIKSLNQCIHLYVELDDLAEDGTRNAVLLQNQSDANIEGIPGELQYPAIYMSVSPSYKFSIPEYYISTIWHECIHLMHHTIGATIEDNAGKGYNSAYNLNALYHMDGILNYENFCDILNKHSKSLNTKELIGVFSVGMYTLEDGERNAWFHSFTSDCNYYFRMKSKKLRDDNQKVLIGPSDKPYENIQTYQHYNYLRQILQKYQHQYDNLYFVIKDNEEALSLVTKYFVDTMNIHLTGEFNLHNIITKWISICDALLKKMCQMFVYIKHAQTQ